MASQALFGPRFDRQSQYRDRLAAQLIAEGSDASPIQHPLQGAARLAQALAGGYIGMKQDQRYAEREKQSSEAMANLFAPTQQFTPSAAGAGPRPGAQMQMVPPTPAEMARRAASHPATQHLAAQYQMEDMRSQRETDAEQRRIQAAKDLKQWEIQNDPSKQLPLVRLYEAHKAQGYTGSLADFQRDQARLNAEGSGPETFGITPTYGTDAQGNPIMLQMGSRGTVRPAQLPPGVSPSPGTQRVDLGTAWGVLDRNGNVVGTIPKDLAGAEREKVLGKASGEGEAGASEAMVKATSILQNIDGVLNHPGIKWGTGATSLLNAIPGTDQFAFGERVKQLQGQAFLQAFESLKGGGQITQVEGDKATAAIARLNTGQSEKDFRQALGELRDIVLSARERARAKLPQQPSASGQTTGAMPEQGAPAITDGATATNPQTGQKIVFRGGQWVPAQ